MKLAAHVLNLTEKTYNKTVQAKKAPLRAKMSHVPFAIGILLASA